MLVEIETRDGPRKVRVCDGCRTVCIPSGRFCSGRCSRDFSERVKHGESIERNREKTEPKKTAG